MSETKTVVLRVHVTPENEDQLVDALNQTLNDLAREDVLNDEGDDAWEWEK